MPDPPTVRGVLALSIVRVIEAAGGLVWRISAKRALKVLLVHRPRYGDWSLPKGKVEAGESPLKAALREVAEETGLSCAACRPLPETRYRDRKGRQKRVRYWAMEPRKGSFRPNHEVDKIRWVRIEDAGELLSYDHDLRVIAALPEAAGLVWPRLALNPAAGGDGHRRRRAGQDVSRGDRPCTSRSRRRGRAARDLP